MKVHESHAPKCCDSNTCRLCIAEVVNPYHAINQCVLSCINGYSTLVSVELSQSKLVAKLDSAH